MEGTIKVNMLLCAFLALPFFGGCDSTKMAGEKPAEETAEIRTAEKTADKTTGNQYRNSLHRSPNARPGLGRLR